MLETDQTIPVVACQRKLRIEAGQAQLEQYRRTVKIC